MKGITIALLVLLAGLQYELWCSRDGIFKTHQLALQLRQQDAVLKQIQAKNDALAESIGQLKVDQQAVEDRVRSDLGMVKSGEEYYQVVE